jgi:predicted GNAT superfamily acetyltransferase
MMLNGAARNSTAHYGMKPDTVQSDMVQSGTVHPETMHSETVHSGTVRSDTMRLDELAAATSAAELAAQAAGVRLRELDTLAEMEAANRLFDEIWQPDPANPVLTLELIRALTKAGSYAAGAYDLDSGTMIGACVGFFGPPHDAELHSHIAGVVPAGLARSVGFALKLHQRAWALRHGVTAISWTFDPLVRRNAYFNMVKLGARPVEYLRNFYGEMNDAINSGVDSDRLLIRWDLRSELAVAASTRQPSPASAAQERERGAVVALSADAGGRPVVALATTGLPVADGSGARTLLVGVPADIEGLRIADPEAAGMWRVALRDVLAPAMAAGARVTGFDRDGWYVVSFGFDSEGNVGGERR